MTNDDRKLQEVVLEINRQVEAIRKKGGQPSLVFLHAEAKEILAMDRFNGLEVIERNSGSRIRVQ